MLHFLLEIIIMTRSTKTRLLLRDKCKVVHSDRLYRPILTLHIRKYLCTTVTVAHTGSALLIAIDNINTVGEIGLMVILLTLYYLITVVHCY